MKIKELLAELQTRECYQNFIKEHPNSYLSICFIVLSNKGDKINLDFFMPSKKQIASFEYPFASYHIHEDEIENAKKLDNLDMKIDLDNLKEKIKEILKREYSEIIAILKDSVWNLTCINGLDIEKIKINALTEEIISQNKVNMMDFVKKLT